MTARQPSKPRHLPRHVIVEICQIVSDMCGNQFEERQFAMVENRLKSRMSRLQITSGAEYLIFLKNNSKSEGEQLLSLLTTHHTYFFREFTHFEHLLNMLPALIAKARQRPDKKIHIWSSACSFGQEVYSLAMFFDYHLKLSAPDVSFEIFGSDVDPHSVKIAQNGVFKYDDLKAAPAIYLGQNWLRGTKEIREFAKVKEHLKSRCSFGVFNLVKPTNLSQRYDLIFCRNVFIYFNQKQIIDASTFLINQLEDDGFLFVGISESLTYLPLAIDHAGPSIYKKRLEKSALPVKVDVTPVERKTHLSLVSDKPIAPPPRPILRVLCVDDSPSILSLLKKILGRSDGFEVVATATNGKEAIEKLRTHTVDLVTLDIHMPEMDGLQYLQQQFKPGHPPIVMLSSVQRDNSDLAIRALKLGAADYVEKPNLANLEDRGDEIRSKLSMAFHNRKATPITSVDTAFTRTYKVSQPEKKLRVAFGGLQTRDRFEKIVKGQDANSPPLILVYEGVGDLTEKMAREIELRTASPVKTTLSRDKVLPGEIYVVDMLVETQQLKALLIDRQASIMICTVPTRKVRDLINVGTNKQIILEDLGETNREIYGEMTSQAAAITPMTSFMSVSEEYFNE